MTTATLSAIVAPTPQASIGKGKNTNPTKTPMVGPALRKTPCSRKVDKCGTVFGVQDICSCIFHMDTNKKEHSMQNNHHSDTTAQLQGLEDFVRGVMQDWRGRGVALAIVRDNEIIYAQGFGQRDETLFPIASCTKAFTTASLAILADQGKLNWDTPVREYIPSFKLYDPFASERVTPRDLVSHRTGLPRHGLVWYHNTTATRRELFERLQHLEPTKDLRSFWQYQNLMDMGMKSRRSLFTRPRLPSRPPERLFPT